MKMIVGLGNPGARYKNTRHNLGFAVLDRVAEKLGVGFDQEKHQAVIAPVSWHGGKVLLVKPVTFMNCSGDAVAPLARNRIDSPESLLVIVDDVNLKLGRLRLRAGGSAGGHNGLKSIIERIGSQEFHRMRLGVGNQAEGQDLARHVLSRFRPEEREPVAAMVDRAVEAVEAWVASGMERAMSAYNER